MAFHAIVLFCPATSGSAAEGEVMTKAAARGAASTAHAESIAKRRENEWRVSGSEAGHSTVNKERRARLQSRGRKVGGIEEVR